MMRGILFLSILVISFSAFGGEFSTMVRIGPGIYRPLYPPSPKKKELPVKAFFLDKTPVTNAAFTEFVEQNVEWRKSRIKKTFADEGYLRHWKNDLSLEKGINPLSPVANVSWFAAKAYCEASGKRLPREEEWELAAAASETKPNGKNDPAWRQKILEWYSSPNLKKWPEVGRQAPNYWGVHDLHGLVWEWVEDFNGTVVTDDSDNKMKFCGGGAVSAKDKENYADFMRLAFRSSLKARYTTENLGFRCAKDLEGEN